MNRNRDERDDEDDRPLKPRRKAGIPTWVIVVVILVPCFFMVAGCGGYLLLWRASAEKVMNRDPSLNKTALPRDEFKTKAVGKTKAEVLEWLGRPKRTATLLGREIWYYDGVTIDVVAGRLDGQISIDFATGDTVVQVVN